MSSPRNTSTKELSDTGRAGAISEAQLDMTWSNDFMLSVKYTGRKINATWQHYIKSFCALIFLFCLCTFVWGVQSHSRGPGGAELARTMWEAKGGNCTCCLFSTVSAVTPKEAASLQTISYSNIHPSLQTGSTAPSAQVPNLTPEFFWDKSTIRTGVVFPGDLMWFRNYPPCLCFVRCIRTG